MISVLEKGAIEHIKKSGEVEIPPNQMAMVNYYNEKIEYLEDAIDILKNQIKEYKIDRKGWNMYRLSNTYNNNNNNNNNTNSNDTIGIGGKRRKTRRMKKL